MTMPTARSSMTSSKISVCTPPSVWGPATHGFLRRAQRSVSGNAFGGEVRSLLAARQAAVLPQVGGLRESGECEEELCPHADGPAHAHQRKPHGNHRVRRSVGRRSSAWAREHGPDVFVYARVQVVIT